MRRTLLARLVAGLAAATLLLAGCGDGDDDGGDQEPQAGPTSTPADPTPSDDPAVASAVEPASGFLIDQDRISMRVPEGWRKVRKMATFLTGAEDPDGFSGVSLGDLSAVGEPSLQELAEFAATTESQTEILEPVEIAGVEWYHVVGREDRYVRFEQFGTVHNGSQATINFSLDDELPAEEQQAIIDSVLATVEWK